jgi:hypothetical protein
VRWPSLRYGVIMAVIWFVSEIHWLLWAGQLELLGWNTFVMVTVAMMPSPVPTFELVSTLVYPRGMRHIGMGSWYYLLCCQCHHCDWIYQTLPYSTICDVSCSCFVKSFSKVTFSLLSVRCAVVHSSCYPSVIANRSLSSQVQSE